MQIRSFRIKTSIWSNYNIKNKDANKRSNFALQIFTDTIQVNSYFCTLTEQLFRQKHYTVFIFC